jgi:hypothetical protein
VVAVTRTTPALGLNDALRAVLGDEVAARTATRPARAAEWYVWMGNLPGKNDGGRFWMPSLFRQETLARVLAEHPHDAVLRWRTGLGAAVVDAHPCAFAECDDCDREEQERRLSHLADKTGLSWALWVFSGGKSIHAYLAFSRLLGAGDPLWQEIQRLLIACLAGDTKIVNHDRLMRLPGFTSPRRTQPILHLAPVRHDPAEIRERLAAYCLTHVGDPATAFATLQLAEDADKAAKRADKAQDTGAAADARALGTRLREARGNPDADDVAAARRLPGAHLPQTAGGHTHAARGGERSLPISAAKYADLLRLPVKTHFPCPICDGPDGRDGQRQSGRLFCHACNARLIPRAAPEPDEVKALWARTAAVTNDPAAVAWMQARGLDPERVAALRAGGAAVCRVLPADCGDLPPWARCDGRPWTESGHRLLFPARDPARGGELASVHARWIGPGDDPGDDAHGAHPAGYDGAGLVLADGLALRLLRGESPLDGATFDHGAALEDHGGAFWLLGGPAAWLTRMTYTGDPATGPTARAGDVAPETMPAALATVAAGPAALSTHVAAAIARAIPNGWRVRVAVGGDCRARFVATMATRHLSGEIACVPWPRPAAPWLEHLDFNAAARWRVAHEGTR